MDGAAPASEIKRLFLCTGKIYYELAEERKKRGATDVAILRVEQLYPWREEIISEALAPYGKATDVAWVQDEPANMGAGFFVEPRLQKLLGKPVRMISRVESASPATGSAKAHRMEQDLIMKQAFGG